MTITVGPVVHRAIVEGDDGAFAYGVATPIDGARICAVARRDAFRSFEPFEDLPEPICAMSRANELTALEVPANSDLILTVTQDGLMPATLTARTDDRDQVPRPWSADIIVALLTPGAVERWLEGSTPPGESHARVALYAPMSWVGPFGGGGPGAEQYLVPAGFPDIVPADGAEFAVETMDGRSVTETTVRRRPSFLALPAGQYRVRYGHPNANCEPVLYRYAIASYGLPTEAADVIELPVRDGHSTVAVVDCLCAPRAAGQRLVDLATCSFEAVDANAP